jgi:hypothetical protein
MRSDGYPLTRNTQLTWHMFVDEARKTYGPATTHGDILGFLPLIVMPGDPRPVREQLAERYAHGGGYRPFGHGKWRFDQDTMKLQYPGDPVMRPLAALTLPASCEMCLFYPHAQMSIVQQDGSFEVVRVD